MVASSSWFQIWEDGSLVIRRLFHLHLFLIVLGTASATAQGFDPLPMRREYEGENLRKASPVYYYPESGRAEIQTVIQGGLIFDAKGQKLTSYLNQSSLYVITPEGELFISRASIHGLIHHSSLSGGRPLLAAGQIVVKDGVVVAIDLQSGHYQFPERYSGFLSSWFGARGVSLPGIGFPGCAGFLKSVDKI